MHVTFFYLWITKGYILNHSLTHSLRLGLWTGSTDSLRFNSKERFMNWTLHLFYSTLMNVQRTNNIFFFWRVNYSFKEVCERRKKRYSSLKMLNTSSPWKTMEHELRKTNLPFHLVFAMETCAMKNRLISPLWMCCGRTTVNNTAWLRRMEIVSKNVHKISPLPITEEGAFAPVQPLRFFFLFFLSLSLPVTHSFNISPGCPVKAC